MACQLFSFLFWLSLSRLAAASTLVPTAAPTGTGNDSEAASPLLIVLVIAGALGGGCSFALVLYKSHSDDILKFLKSFLCCRFRSNGRQSNGSRPAPSDRGQAPVVLGGDVPPTWGALPTGHVFALHPVIQDSDVWRAVVALFSVDDPLHLGYGRDVKEKETRRYSKLTPIRIWEIDAPMRKTKYYIERDEILQKLDIIQKARAAALPHVRCKTDVAGAFAIDSRVNEKMLLHGTQPETVTAVLQNGMNERYSVGYFGSGSYLAEDAAKIDQYCSSDTEASGPVALHQTLYTSLNLKHPGRVFYAFICRTILGIPVYTKDGFVSSDFPGVSLFASSDQRELAPIPQVDPSMPFQSLILECGPTTEGYAVARHREFVIYHAAQIQPEFLVAYVRE